MICQLPLGITPKRVTSAKRQIDHQAPVSHARQATTRVRPGKACRRYRATKDDGNVTFLLFNNIQSAAPSVLLPAGCISLVVSPPV
jgi:hypothetical protein